MINDLTHDEFGKLVASVGTHKGKRHLLPFECSALIIKAIENSTKEELSEVIGISPSQISKFVNLNALPSDIRKMVCFGKQKGCISFSAAAEMASLKSLEDRLGLAKATLEHDLRKDEVISVVQRINRSDLELEVVVDEILKLRPQIEQQYLFLVSLDNLRYEDELEFKREIRKRLAKKIGGTNVHSISIGENRLAILLSEEGAQSPNLDVYKQSGSMGDQIQSLLKEKS